MQIFILGGTGRDSRSRRLGDVAQFQRLAGVVSKEQTRFCKFAYLFDLSLLQFAFPFFAVYLHCHFYGRGRSRCHLRFSVQCGFRIAHRYFSLANVMIFVFRQYFVDIT